MCSSEVTFVDVDTRETFVGKDSEKTVIVTNITFSTEQLRENRHYNVTVFASNIVGTSIFNEIPSKYNYTMKNNSYLHYRHS